MNKRQYKKVLLFAAVASICGQAPVSAASASVSAPTASRWSKKQTVFWSVIASPLVLLGQTVRQANAQRVTRGSAPKKLLSKQGLKDFGSSLGAVAQDKWSQLKQVFTSVPTKGIDGKSETLRLRSKIVWKNLGIFLNNNPEAKLALGFLIVPMAVHASVDFARSMWMPAAPAAPRSAASTPAAAHSVASATVVSAASEASTGSGEAAPAVTPVAAVAAPSGPVELVAPTVGTEDSSGAAASVAAASTSAVAAPTTASHVTPMPPRRPSSVPLESQGSAQPSVGDRARSASNGPVAPPAPLGGQPSSTIPRPAAPRSTAPSPRSAHVSTGSTLTTGNRAPSTISSVTATAVSAPAAPPATATASHVRGRGAARAGQAASLVSGRGVGSTALRSGIIQRSGAQPEVDILVDSDGQGDFTLAGRPSARGTSRASASAAPAVAAASGNGTKSSPFPIEHFDVMPTRLGFYKKVFTDEVKQLVRRSGNVQWVVQD